MGYACPVCGAEQADGVHLANHLAVTASLGRPDHESWLAEYAPDWGDDSPADLADRVVPHAREIETPEFETDDGARPETGFEHELAARSRGPGRGSRTAGGRAAEAEPAAGAAGRTDDVESILAEARELTDRMRSKSTDDEAENRRPDGADSTGADDGTDPVDRGDAATDRAETAADPDENA